MGSILLKKTAFLIFIVSFVLCDEVIEKMERRINELETLNKELKVRHLFFYSYRVSHIEMFVSKWF